MPDTVNAGLAHICQSAKSLCSLNGKLALVALKKRNTAESLNYHEVTRGFRPSRFVGLYPRSFRVDQVNSRG